jgi:ABC-type sugar transport system permease subunit
MTAADVSPSSSGSRAARIIVGLVLVFPASIACFLSFLLPTLRTLSMSFQDVRFLSDSAEFIGMDNYAELGDLMRTGGGIGTTMLLLVVRVLAVAILPPLVALGVSRSARAMQLVTHLILSIPLALYAPLLTLAGWFLMFRPQIDGMQGILLVAEFLLTMTLATAVMLPAYLAALRGSNRRAFGLLWVLSLLAIIAVTLQAFVMAYLMGSRSQTLMFMMYRLGFVNMQMGAASAVSMVILIPVMLLGVAAALVIVLSGLVIRMLKREQTEGQNASMVLGMVMVLLALIVCGLSALPFGAQIGGVAEGAERLQDSFNFLQALFVTLAPPLIGVLLIQLPLTYLAALGIGALRPFGRRSELLLLPFSPWLFVTAGPLALVSLLSAMDLDMVDTFIVLLPRFGLSIPMLFVLTLFFRGQVLQREALPDEAKSGAGGFMQQVILPSLPLALLLAGVAVLIAAQSLLWPLIASRSPEQSTLPLWVARMIGQFGFDNTMLNTLILQAEIPMFLLFVIIIMVFQVFYLPRLMVATGADTAPAAPVVLAESTETPGTIQAV